MKRLPQCLLALLLLINFPARAVDIFVATNGSDLNEGTNAKPLATITAALRKARELRRLNDVSIANGIYIIVKGGVYNLTEAIEIKPMTVTDEEFVIPAGYTDVKNQPEAVVDSAAAVMVDSVAKAPAVKKTINKKPVKSNKPKTPIKSSAARRKE